MNLDLPYNLSEKENPEQLSPAEITGNWISYAVARKHPDGMKGPMLRTWGRLQRKIDGAIETGAAEIEITPDEKDFLRRTVLDDDIAWPPAAAKTIMLVQDEMERL